MEELEKNLQERIIEYIEKKKELPFSFFKEVYNPYTGTIYSGINNIQLNMELLDRGIKDSRFLTFNNIQDLGLNLNKGAKSFNIRYVTYSYYEKNTDKYIDLEYIKKNNLKKGLDYIKTVKVKKYNIFSTIDVTPSFIKKAQLPVDFEKNIQNLIKEENIKIINGGKQASYTPSKDVIEMPLKNFYENNSQYYYTLLHEIAHWTAKKDRVPRDTTIYAKEEITAELAANFVGARLGLPIKDNIKESSNYIDSYLKEMKKNPNFISEISFIASKISEFIYSKATGKKIKEQRRIEIKKEIIKKEQIKYPFYGKTEEEMKPYLKNLLNGETIYIENMISAKGKSFSADIKLIKKGDEIKAKFVFKKTKSQPQKKQVKNKKTRKV